MDSVRLWVAPTPISRTSLPPYPLYGESRILSLARFVFPHPLVFRRFPPSHSISYTGSSFPRRILPIYCEIFQCFLLFFDLFLLCSPPANYITTLIPLLGFSPHSRHHVGFRSALTVPSVSIVAPSSCCFFPWLRLYPTRSWPRFLHRRLFCASTLYRYRASLYKYIFSSVKGHLKM